MILFDDIIKDLIGEHHYDERVIAANAKQQLILSYSKAVDAFISLDVSYPECAFEFREAMKGIVPDVYEKAMSLKFEKDIRNDIFDIIEQQDLAKSAVDKRLPQFKELHDAISSMLYLNPLLIPVDVGYYQTQDGTPVLSFEITDFDKALFQIASPKYEVPAFDASWLLEEGISPEFVYQFQYPVYLAGLLVRDILEGIRVTSGDFNKVVPLIASSLVPLAKGGTHSYQDPRGQFSLPVCKVGIEAQQIGVDKIPSDVVRDFLTTDINSLVQFMMNGNVSQYHMEKITAPLFGNYSGLTHRQILTSVYPDIAETPIKYILDSYEKHVINPAVIDAAKDRMNHIRIMGQVNMLYDERMYNAVLGVLQNAQQMALMGIAQSIKNMSKYYGYENVVLRIGSYINTDMTEPFIDAGLDVMHIRRGV